MSRDVQERIQTADLDDVLRYYVKGFQLPDGTEMLDCETFVDMSKRKVIFRMITSSKEPEKKQQGV